MLASRLDIKKYPWANPAKRLNFKYPHQSEIDPVFAGRLAALAAYLKWIFLILRGSATYEEQVAIGDQIMKKNPTYTRRPNGAVYNTKGQCIVAAPGTSPHQFDIAVDGDKRIEVISDAVLKRFGLCRPMPYEPWHIQPIETLGIPFSEREKFRPYRIPKKLVDFQKENGLVPDGVYGPATHEAARKLWSGS